jgi:hypothetical protein
MQARTGKSCQSHGKSPDANRHGLAAAITMAGFRVAIPDQSNMPDRGALRHHEIEWFLRTIEARGVNNTIELSLVK